MLRSCHKRRQRFRRLLIPLSEEQPVNHECEPTLDPSATGVRGAATGDAGVGNLGVVTSRGRRRSAERSVRAA